MLPISYGKENYSVCDVTRIVVAAKSEIVKSGYFDNKKIPKIRTSESPFQTMCIVTRNNHMVATDSGVKYKLPISEQLSVKHKTLKSNS